MRLGTRWAAHTEPPAAVPQDVRAEIAAVEASLGDLGYTPYWTLTWLEGRPVAECDAGVIITVDRNGAVLVQHDED